MRGRWRFPAGALLMTDSRSPQARRAASGRAAFHRGHGRERRAVWWLRLKGYRILAINWRSPVGEIDLVARRGACLAVIEVKQRADTDTATGALAPAQMRRLARAAELFLAQHPSCGGLSVRFDLIVFGALGRPVHLKDAWRPG
jgi:putative endonuclease